MENMNIKLTNLQQENTSLQDCNKIVQNELDSCKSEILKLSNAPSIHPGFFLVSEECEQILEECTNSLQKNFPILANQLEIEDSATDPLKKLYCSLSNLVRSMIA